MNALLDLDKKILLLLNGLHSPLMDEIMWFFSRIPVWIPLYVLLIIFIILKFGKKIMVDNSGYCAFNCMF
jgi:undecaprenyl-diphosphatase